MSLISYQQALSRVLDQVPSPEVEAVPLHRSLGRVLATSARADMAMPSFKKSFMDGYALRSQDVQKVPALLEVVGKVSAGSAELPRIGRNEAVQVATGAPVPATADAVQMVEKTRREGPRVMILEVVVPGQHVAVRGSEVEEGQVVVEKGRRIGPQEIAVLACFGYSEVETWRPPRVAIISTGNELVEIEETPGFGEIRNSNAHMLWAQCQELELDARIEPIAKDEPLGVREAIRQALGRELVVLSGGVSMGEYDYVHQVLAEEGVEILFHKAAIKPGKPVLVGRREGRMLFGLPGNPVSSFVTFMLFVKPAVQKWCGGEPRPFLEVQAELKQEVRQKPGRQFFMPARARLTPSGITVCPLKTKGSADIAGFARANALLSIPADQERIPEGAMVEVLLMEGRSFD